MGAIINGDNSVRHMVDLFVHANPDITWEIARKHNLGLELGLFKDQSLMIQVDFFKDFRSRIYMKRENFPQIGRFQTDIHGNVE